MINYENLKIIIRIFFISFSCFCPAQQITVDNKNSSPVQVKYAQEKIEVAGNQKKKIIAKGLKSISIFNKNNEKLNRDIPIFLDPDQSLDIILAKDSIKFLGDKDHLHEYNYAGFWHELTLKIPEYQKFYQKNDPNGFIRASELALGNVLAKVERLNNSPSGRNDNHFKEIEKAAKKRWFFTVFVSFNGMKIGETEKELMKYYYEKYFKKDIASYNCNSWDEYEIIRRFSQHSKTLHIKLPRYEIVEHTDDDEINQYLPFKCQEEYFRNSYNFYINKKDEVRAEKFKRILTEKFHAKP
ncbi:hypothetical protein [Chryseobacterium daeguense]|uniref:hypothetical protein n=1 Tax=Chryseobacterium daeguense TaxID=412438 RepID=UPI00040A6927|nr:hypothetical protein [Chryseobacterium daeguense]